MIAPNTVKRRGRPSAWHLTDEETDALRGLVLMRSTEHRIHFSLAVEEFVHHPACLPATRDLIESEILAARAENRRTKWPMSIRRLGNPGDAATAMFRGPKHMSNAAPSIRRGKFWVDAEGNERDLLPHDIWESDDMSVNEPFRWRDKLTGLWMAGRQTLASIDVGSGGWLGATCLGRPRDAYRQEDIADHMLDLCELWGLPRVWRLERGSWMATFTGGVEMEGMATRWGCMDPLFRIVHTQHARGKGLIEGRFDFLQTFLGHTEGGLTMGRKPDDFERVSKLMRRVGYDRRRAEDDLPTEQAAVQRLWPIDEATAAIRRAMEGNNARPMERVGVSGLTVPTELLAGRRGRDIPESERWRFCGYKGTCTVNREGCIEVNLPHYDEPFRFSVNGVGGLYLPSGYPLFIAFSPQRPEDGATLGNRDRSARNRDSWGMGEIIPLHAPYQPLYPQVDLTALSGAAGPGIRKGFAAAVRQEFRGVRQGMHTYVAARKEHVAAQEAAMPAAARSEVRDGLGGRTEISRGLASRPAPAKAAAEPQPSLASFRGRSLGDTALRTMSAQATTDTLRDRAAPPDFEPSETITPPARSSLRDRSRALLGETI